MKPNRKVDPRGRMAFDIGRMDYDNQYELDHNPFDVKVDSEMYLHWIDGWYEGQNDRLDRMGGEML